LEGSEGILWNLCSTVSFYWYSKNQLKLNGLFIIQHFFGGAMGVFTTRTLLSSVGVSQSKVTPGAIAINWILKVKILCSFRALISQSA